VLREWQSGHLGPGGHGAIGRAGRRDQLPGCPHPDLHGASQPNASNINYGGGQTVANSFNVGLSAGGAMDLFVHVSGTDVILDIAGYML
jgi:hypothetical protein